MSNVTFYDRVEDALNKPIQRGAFDRATQRLQGGRLSAFAAFAIGDETRDRARLIRAHTISQLDTYLAQFAASVERVGGVVHWANDAHEAVKIVREIAASNAVKTVVKSKSMLSEEIHLNHALEQGGIEVVESDLGEYIIQLAGETPSHIIAPVIHRIKGQVAEVLHDKVGMPMTDDVAEMNAFVRGKLRRVFLTADMGISGVNFGVAQTGTIVTVTNEGNGRMTTTMPRIHVAMMGIERLVPTLDDLSVMLQVLARSATGQKLSVYSNLITGARRAGEHDGPEQLHVVLVDNGRSKLLVGECAEMLYCIRCGACLNACPVYKQIGGHAYGGVYTGPMGAVLTPLLNGISEWSDLPHASSLCGACRDACPVRIDLPRMLLELRNEGNKAGKTPTWITLGVRAFKTAAVSPTLFKMGARMARLGTSLIARHGWINKLPAPLKGWTQSRDFPSFAPKTFSEMMRDRRQASGVRSQKKQP